MMFLRNSIFLFPITFTIFSTFFWWFERMKKSFEDDELPLEWVDDEVVEDYFRDGCTKVDISIVLYRCRVWLLSWVGIAICNESTFIYH